MHHEQRSRLLGQLGRSTGGSPGLPRLELAVARRLEHGQPDRLHQRRQRLVRQPRKTAIANSARSGRSLRSCHLAQVVDAGLEERGLPDPARS